MPQHIEGPVNLHSPKRRLAEGEFNNIEPIVFRRSELYHITGVDDRVLITALETKTDFCAYDVDMKLAGAPDEDVPLQMTDAGPRAAAQTFTHTIAIVMPASFYLPFLLDAAGKPPDDRLIYNIKPLWGEFYRAIVVANREWLEGLIHDVVWVALDLGNFEAVKRCLDSHRELAEVWAVRFGKVVFTQGIERVQPVIDHLWSLVSSSPVGHIGSLARMRSIWTDPSVQHTPNKAMEWYGRTLDMLFCRLEQKDPAYLGTAEGLDLAVAVPNFPESFFDARVVPFATRMASKTSFIIPFVTLLHREHQEGSARFPTFPAVYRSLVPAILQDFSPFTCRFSKYSQTYKRDQLVNPTHISWLIEQSRKMGLDMAEVLTTMERKINAIQRDHDIFPLFTTRLVRILCENLREKHQSDFSAAAGSEEGAFVVRLVKFYVTPSAGPCPPLPQDWRQSLPNVKPDCCLDCAELRRFVEDPIERQKEFRMIEQRRLHIETKLSQHFIFYTIRDGTPHTLRIMKTQAEALEQRDSWMGRAAEKRVKLETLNQKVLLRETLGDHAYQDICACVADPAAATALDPVQTGSQPPTLSGPPQVNMQARTRLRPPLEATAPVIPRKRSLIDLDLDSDGAEDFPSTCKRR
ncbi:hypothetical protein ASPCAL07658 [Aspergillus calidoustus]|uniref:Uncharacterized protein n=1 Tax=Aspergillus calidoustus TaxID=454130 RepID=A0A0U5GSG6_ASPCI|nr:hypothetical protein ASPCAL07658 [Aspergillus calidoustus]